MSDKARTDALRELAANRGCKLVASRRRTPGRGDYGRYGLKDASTGKAVLGIGKKGLTATPEEIEAFLRGGAAAGWKRSLGATAKARRRAKQASPPDGTEESGESGVPEEVAQPEDEPPAPPRTRDARPADAAGIAALIVALGYEVSVAEVKKRLAAMKRAGEPAVVAVTDRLVGTASWHVTPVLHRPRPVGRITMMVVDEHCRGQGVGTALVAAVEARLKARGCGLVEVTSNRKRLRAHAFYEGLGFARTSYRFAKDIAG